MGPKTQEVVIARDIFTLVAALSYWSSEGMQNFIESGILHDVVRALKSDDSDIKLAPFVVGSIGSVGFSKEAGNLTMKQLRKLLDIIPLEDVVIWDSLITLFQQWSQTSSWWDNNKPSWQDRDDWREGVGMERINPILKNNDADNPVAVTFRKIGNEDVWKSPPDGYRYATVEEIKRTKVPKGYGRSTFVNTDGKWYFTDGYNSLPLVDEHVTRCFRYGISQNGNSDRYVVAIVKIET
ncbi:hypothetical protein K9M47_04805 [Candidatus Gracilibacteria bacterium]|nr:hypothetical protein [Candidatus Gracilibacteria bacterium]MCF7898900.1 hypothetical protein [Candidatus Paceibacterota bacterium]